jgi:hypothetical protein
MMLISHTRNGSLPLILWSISSGSGIIAFRESVYRLQWVKTMMFSCQQPIALHRCSYGLGTELAYFALLLLAWRKLPNFI